jgi:hypothetical protein
MVMRDRIEAIREYLDNLKEDLKEMLEGDRK